MHRAAPWQGDPPDAANLPYTRHGVAPGRVATGQRRAAALQRATERRIGSWSWGVRCLYAAALLSSVALCGCIRTFAAEPGVVTIRSSFWGDVADIQVWEELARRFNARHSRI